MQIERLSLRDITSEMPVLIGVNKPFLPGGRFKGEVPPPPPPPSYSEEEIRNAEREAYKKGFIEGTNDGIRQTQSEQAEVDRKLMEMATHFAACVAPMFDNYREMAAACRDQMPKLALAIARKAAGAALTANAEAAIHDVTTRCVETMINEPGLVVTVHESLAQALEQKLAMLAVRMQSAADIRVIGDPALGIADCRVEWKKGSFVRQTDQLWQEIEHAIETLSASVRHDTQVNLAVLGEKVVSVQANPVQLSETDKKE